jgi:hypothetical protein
MTHALRALGAGEHVCWQVSSPEEYKDGRPELIAHAVRSGGRLVIVGVGEVIGASGPVSVLDPGREDALAAGRHGLLDALRSEVGRARGGGTAVHVLAGMEHFASPYSAFADLVMHEMDVADLAGDSGASVVCAYARHTWKPETVQDVAALHSRVVGADPRLPSFSLTRVATHRWRLQGSVGFESRRAFSATLRGAFSRTPHVHLSCAGLDLIDAAGLQTLVETVAATPGGSILLDRVNETVLTVWRLSGYAGLGAAIEVRA